MNDKDDEDFDVIDMGDDKTDTNDPKFKEFMKKSSAAMRLHDKQKVSRLMLKHRMADNRYLIVDKKVMGPLLVLPVTFSYLQLRDILNGLNEQQLAQQAQIFKEPLKVGDTTDLEPIIGAGTVEEMLHVDGKIVTPTHNCTDWQHHPEQFILVQDSHTWGEDGDTAYEMKEIDGEIYMIGNISGKIKEPYERKEDEPSTKASRAPLMQPRSIFTTKELVDRLEELLKVDLSAEDEREVYWLQAELYRRKYHLSPKKEKNEGK